MVGKLSWQTVIGLEVHAQIKSEKKLFSAASGVFTLDPNTQVDLFDAAMPGTLPVLNTFCVEQAMKSAMALNCRVHEVSYFDRKNYFYPDLPSGYQITQFHKPIATNGSVIVIVGEEEKKIRINRLHMEQDAGKLIHDMDDSNSLVDLNRAGVGLMEIVSEPDIRSSEEAAAYVAELRNILRYVDTCDGQMQQASFRVDANISVNKEGDPFGKRCEVKNLNSLKFLRQAILYEEARQRGEIEAGREIVEETLLFDSKTGKTFPIRKKESMEEYRYFPDPDVLPLVLTKEKIEEVRRAIPELPAQKRGRFVRMGLTQYQAGVLTSEKQYADYFDLLLSHNCEPGTSANWMISELFGLMNKKGIKFEDLPVFADDLADLIERVESKQVSARQGKEILATLFETGGAVDSIIKEMGITQISDSQEIKKIVEKVLQANPSQCEELKNGKLKVKAWLVGQVMKDSKGAADPVLVNSMIDELIKVSS